MRQFKCSICGFVYDETVGMPEKGIAPQTKWESTPHDFICPWCGAPKTVFVELQENQLADTLPSKQTGQDEHFGTLRELMAGELSAICSNLAKGCEKQHLTEEMNLFNQLADYYQNKVASQDGQNLNEVGKLLDADLMDGYPKANAVAAAKLDRGALRALVWSEKVSKMLSSHLARYAKEGSVMLANTGMYVCDICGFVYIGNELPDICPVCKVPNFKISQIGRK